MYILNGRVIDPANNLDEIKDVRIADGRVASLGKFSPGEIPAGAEVIDASKYWLVPALIDLHVHFREPGQTHKETIEIGARAAAAGGFGTVCCMPNTTPYADSPEIVKWIADRSAAVSGGVNVLPVGGLTVGQRGEKLAPLREMAESGAAAFSEDGRSVLNDELMYEALKTAASLDKPVFSHCEELSLVNGGVVHEGVASRKFGLPGISSESEYKIVERDIALARKAGARLHICHISAAESVDAVRRARAGGMDVTAEVCPHHFAFCDEDITEDDGRFKMNPPLRSRRDREALLEGLSDGTLTVIATDHAPHAAEEKDKGLLSSAFGVIGLETAVSAGITYLTRPGIISPARLISAMTSEPARVLGLGAGSLAPGSAACLTVIDPNGEICPGKFFSKGNSSPFKGVHLYGKIMYTIFNGDYRFKDGGVVGY